MIKVVETAAFADWLTGLRDVSARARIVARIRRAQGGNLGDVKHFDGIGEMRSIMGRAIGCILSSEARSW